MEVRDMSQVLRRGVRAVLGTLLLGSSSLWWGHAVAHEKVELADYKNQVMVQNTEHNVTQKQADSLEIRGVGIGIYHDHQSEIWEFIKKKNNNAVSVFSSDPKDYDPSLDSREISADIKIRVAFKHSASESVAYWPIPVFALGPPNPYEKPYRAANLINAGRNAATLGVTLFLWQDDESTSHAQAMIERLFQFFNDNPQVPQALIVS